MARVDDQITTSKRLAYVTGRPYTIIFRVVSSVITRTCLMISRRICLTLISSVHIDLISRLVVNCTRDETNMSVFVIMNPIIASAIGARLELLNFL